MPHLTVDYSPNLEPDLDVSGLCEALRLAGIETGVFPVTGIRVRAHRADYYAIADGDAANAYIDIGVRLRGGRDLETRKSATEHLFSTAKSYLDPLIATRPIAVSMEMRDIDPQLSPKLNTIADHMKEG
jgi:5-carboxymethyl-2-hydroxymuconate isomerase